MSEPQTIFEFLRAKNNEVIADKVAAVDSFISERANWKFVPEYDTLIPFEFMWIRIKLSAQIRGTVLQIIADKYDMICYDDILVYIPPNARRRKLTQTTSYDGKMYEIVHEFMEERTIELFHEDAGLMRQMLQKMGYYAVASKNHILIREGCVDDASSMQEK